MEFLGEFTCYFAPYLNSILWWYKLLYSSSQIDWPTAQKFWSNNQNSIYFKMKFPIDIRDTLKMAHLSISNAFTFYISTRTHKSGRCIGIDLFWYYTIRYELSKIQIKQKRTDPYGKMEKSWKCDLYKIRYAKHQME